MLRRIRPPGQSPANFPTYRRLYGRARSSSRKATDQSFSTAAPAFSRGKARCGKKTPCREAGRLCRLRSIALRGRSPIEVSDQGCCGSLPLLKVSSGCHVLQKCSAVKVVYGCGPCGLPTPAGVSDWTCGPKKKSNNGQNGGSEWNDLRSTRRLRLPMFGSPVFTKLAQ